jgi:hypothetical protein
MEELKVTPNSHKYKAEVKANKTTEDTKRVTKVVKGKMNDKKRSERSKFVSEMCGHLFTEIFVPAAKSFVWDAARDGLSMILFGEVKHTGNRPNASRVSYSSYYNDPRDSQRYSAPAPKARRGYEYDDIIFDNKGDAELVLDTMVETIERYGHVTILDLYDLADLTAPTHTSNRYGWTNLRSAETVRVRDGYILKLPKAVVID